MASNATVPALPPIPPIIVQLTGPLFLGHLFNWGLFGVLSVQAYIYYISFPKDRTLPKVLVATVYGLEVLQTILSTFDGFRNFGFGYGNMIDLNTVGMYWFSVVFLEALISFISQVFYAWRIWLLSSLPIVPGLIFLLAIVQCGAGMWTAIHAHQIGIFSEVQHHNATQSAIWLGGTALCDVIIAASMIYYLIKARTGFLRTNTILTRIIRITVETGFITAAFAVIDLSLFLAFEEVNFHLAPSIALAKLYSNSLLVVLNSRVRIQGGRDAEAVPSDKSLSSSLNWASRTATADVHQLSQTSRNNLKTFNISVSQDHHTQIDSMSDAQFGGHKTHY